MTDPVVSNVHVAAPELLKALEASLPPCLRIAVFEGWAATFYDEKACDHKDTPSLPARYEVLLGRPSNWLPWLHEDHHHQALVPWGGLWVTEQHTDNPDEAERLWLEACERLRGMP